MKQKLTTFLDIFYPPFRGFMPVQTFRYAACGGINTLLGLAIYFISYTFLLSGKNLDVGFFAFKPHVAALFFSTCVSFVVGFTLNKYVVFTSSNLKGRIQLFRYFLSFMLNLVINYLLLKLFVELLRWNALTSQVITTIIIITFSYLSQKHFSFRINNKS